MSDLSSESLELTTMPESLLLPQSRVSGFNAGGDLLSVILGEAIGWEMGGGGWCDAGANAGTGRFGLGVVEVALEATDAERTSLGTGTDDAGGTNFGGFVDNTGVMEIAGLLSCTGTSFGGSLVEMGLIGGGGLAVAAVPDAMMIFWLLSVFMMGLLVVE